MVTVGFDSHKMNGQQFVDTLKRIGYPGVDQLDGSSLDWMFDYKPLQPFLQWFCDEIGPANILDAKEVEEFQRLETSNEGILEGDQLEKALKNLALLDIQGEETSEDNLREEIAHLEEELQCSRLRRDVLVQQRDKLVVHQTGLGDRVARFDGVVNGGMNVYKKSIEEIQQDNDKMNETLASVTPSISQLISLYQRSAAGTEAERRISENPVFLSHLDLEQYHKSEEGFTQELVNFTKKQFFEGIAEMAGQNEGSHYEFLEIGNPDSLLVKGKSEELNLDDCKELARLQAFYPISECKRINASIEERSESSACDFQEQMMSLLKEHPYPNDIPTLSARLREAQSVLAQVNRDVIKLSDHQIPGLVKDSATHQVAKILRGDYDLKIARQDYFTCNQDQVIEQLVVQRSRNEFLTMALEVESRSHRDLHKLLLAINILLQQTHSAFQNRIKMMSELDQSVAKQQRTTIDSRDTFLHRLHHLLDDASNSEFETQQPQKLFVTYAELAENSEKLAQQVAALKATESTANQTKDDHIASLAQQVSKCEAILYPDGITNASQPVLCPRTIRESMAQLDGLMIKLEQAVMDVMKDVEQKKKSLQSDPLLAVERELFVYFFNDADRLRRAFADIQSRLQSHLVK